MNVLCSICRELFTGGDNEKIYTTTCGHVFHHLCLFQWIQRSKSCPQCRTKLTNKNMFKLNLHIEGSAAPKTGLEDHEQTNLQFELHMKEMELRQLRESCKVATDRNKGLRNEAKRFESEIMSAKSRECKLLEEIKKLKVELRHERLKNSRFGEGSNTSRNAVHDLIDLDNSDPSLLIDIDDNLRAARSNSHRDDDPEVINLDDSEMEDVQPHHHQEQPNRAAEVEDLKSQMELKEVLLSSAVARIAELEEENRTLKQNSRF